MRSLRVRLLLALTVIPVVALASVGVAMHYTNTTNIQSGASFQVVPVSRAHGGPRSSSAPDAELIGVETPVSVIPDGRAVVFQPVDGEALLIQADPSFVAAFERDQQRTISTLNKQLVVAVVGAALLAMATAFFMWRRIAGPIRSLTQAVRRMETGSLSARVTVSSRDELGELGHAFNAMAASLERQESLRKTMTSDIAHELRTPLNNLGGYLDAISDGLVQADPAVISSLQEEVQGLVRLTNDLEQLALADAGQLPLVLEPTHVARVIERTVSLVRAAAAERRVAVTPVFDADLPVVEADQVRVGQVIRNLVENALRHSPPGGEVRVMAHQDGDWLRVSVSDNGPGVPPDDLPFIFERFYRADRSRSRHTGGAGLGLAIVRQLVEAHGGTIRAYNLDFGGACLEVALPIGRPGPSLEPSRALTMRPGGLHTPA